ncbi:hypothetical protein FB381_1653 [Nocardioides albertanoniae]|uniref:Uncharacterized protein n=1 Tax=Nocardioides albertanoniae TaxID=1175486 RepID=A0A543A594_9ACTN|nr:hypothetical protein [Nocardioides albertanoniae]TQL67771.1 hypothetical protein FB381_1653 [Nocardioides albertanoniae]
MGTNKSTSTVLVMLTGLALSVAAVAVVYVDRATTNVLADHIRAGYPSYGEDRIGEGVRVYTTYLTVLGAIGVIGWAVSLWVSRVRPRVAPWLVTTLFLLGTGVALFNLTIRDTSGETGLAPQIGWVGMLPSIAGLAAVVLVWRESTREPTREATHEAVAR